MTGDSAAGFDGADFGPYRSGIIGTPVKLSVCVADNIVCDIAYCCTCTALLAVLGCCDSATAAAAAAAAAAVGVGWAFGGISGWSADGGLASEADTMMVPEPVFVKLFVLPSRPAIAVTCCAATALAAAAAAAADVGLSNACGGM